MAVEILGAFRVTWDFRTAKVICTLKDIIRVYLCSPYLHFASHGAICIKVYMHIVTTAHVPMDHRQNSVTFLTKIYILFFSPSVTESKRKYQRIRGKRKDCDIIA